MASPKREIDSGAPVSTYVRVLTLEAAIIVLLWLIGRTFS